ECFARKPLKRYFVEAVPLRAADDAQDGISSRRLRPRLRRAPLGDSFGAQVVDPNVCALGIFTERNNLAIAQCRTAQAAESSTQIRRAAAEHRRHGKATEYGKPAATALLWAGD